MHRRCRPLLGTFVEITADNEAAIEAAFAAVAQAHRLMSAHEPDSDLSHINRYGHRAPVQLHEATARVLRRALYWAERSDGAFDPVRAGKTALETGHIPRHSDQPDPSASHWSVLAVEGHRGRLTSPACVDLGGIAKGFAVDMAVDVLRAAGHRGLVNAGGDLRAFGPDPWTVTVVEPLSRRPIAEIELSNEALATSAGLPVDEHLSFEHLGSRNDRWSSVSIVAPTACDADALAKIAWHGGDEILLLGGPGLRALGITHAGDIEPVSPLERVIA